MESLKWIYGYLWFHRRIIFGILLLIGLFYWINYGKDLIPKMSLKGVLPAKNRPDSEPRTLPKLNDVPHRTPALKSGSSNLQETTAESSLVTEDENSEGTIDKPQSTSNSFERWLATAPANELIERSLALNKEWRSAGRDYPYAFLLVSKRKKISERLLEMNLSEFQERYATVNFLESLSILDSTNVQGKLKSDNVRAELIQVMSEYMDHPDQEISGLAHLSIMVVPGYEFLVTPNPELLRQFENELDQHFDNIAKSNECSQKLAELLVLVYKSDTLPNETKLLFQKAIERFESDTSDAGKIRFTQLQGQYFFGRLDLPTMVDRVSSRQKSVDADVEAFVSALEEYPTASLKVHQRLLDIVREYIRQGRKDMAQQILGRLELQILPNISDEDDRRQVQEAADDFKAFL